MEKGSYYLISLVAIRSLVEGKTVSEEYYFAHEKTSEVVIVLPLLEQIDPDIAEKCMRMIADCEFRQIIEICDREYNDPGTLRKFLGHLARRRSQFELLFHWFSDAATDINDFLVCISNPCLTRLSIKQGFMYLTGSVSEHSREKMRVSALSTLCISFVFAYRYIDDFVCIPTLRRLKLDGINVLPYSRPDVCETVMMKKCAQAITKSNVTQLVLTGNYPVDSIVLGMISRMPLIELVLHESRIPTGSVDHLFSIIASHASLRLVSLYEVVVEKDVVRTALQCVKDHGPFVYFQWMPSAAAIFEDYDIEPGIDPPPIPDWDLEFEYSEDSEASSSDGDDNVDGDLKVFADEVLGRLEGHYKFPDFEFHDGRRLTRHDSDHPSIYRNLNDHYGNDYGLKTPMPVANFLTCKSFAIQNQPDYNVDGMLNILQIDSTYTSTAHVRNLDIVGSKLAPSTIENLSGCKNLKSLSFMDCDFIPGSPVPPKRAKIADQDGSDDSSAGGSA